MSFFSWLKKLFTEPVIKEKAEAVVEEVKNTVSEGIDEIKLEEKGLEIIKVGLLLMILIPKRMKPIKTNGAYLLYWFFKWVFIS